MTSRKHASGAQRAQPGDAHGPLDREKVDVAGQPAVRLLAHCRHPEFGGVNREQWLVREGDLGYVTSCTTAAREYDDLWALMQAIGGELRLG